MAVCAKSLLVLWYQRMTLGSFLFKYRVSSSKISLMFTVFFFVKPAIFPFLLMAVKLDPSRVFVGA